MQTKQISPAAVVVAISSVEKDFDTVTKAMSFDDKGNMTLRKGFSLSAMEAGATAGELINRGESVRIQAANVLRYVRTLPPIEGVNALDVALLQFRKTCRSEGEFATVAKLMPALDIIEANKLAVSPFVVLEVLGTLRATGALQDKTKGDKIGTLTLTNGEGEFAKPIIDKLKDGTATANKIRETCREVKEAKEKAEAKKKADAARETLAKAGGVTTPAPAPEAPALPTIAPEENVRLAIIAASALWDKKVGEGLPVAKVREHCKQSIEALAKLAGFKLSPL